MMQTNAEHRGAPVLTIRAVELAVASRVSTKMGCRRRHNRVPLPMDGIKSATCHKRKQFDATDLALDASSCYTLLAT